MTTTMTTPAVPPPPPLPPRIPETKKRPGVHYAVTNDGLELPVVDVTHPAFAAPVTDDEQRVLVDRFVKEGQPLEWLPAALRRRILGFLLARSYLGRDLLMSQGRFLSGTATYVLKLGPENLGAYASRVDRRVAASFPALTMRWRLRDMARLLADVLAPGLGSGPGPVHLLNVAGGAGLDSLNALVLLRDEQPLAVQGRRFVVRVLDGDDDGPAFGARAVAAWRSEGAPLATVDVAFEHVRYDWSRPDDLKAALDRARSEGARVVASSEGGLFEYGSDRDIVENLRVLRDGAPGDVAFVGSVTRADAPIQRLLGTGGPALRPRGLPVFQGLARAAGFEVSRVIERPFSDHVVLVVAR